MLLRNVDNILYIQNLCKAEEHFFQTVLQLENSFSQIGEPLLTFITESLSF